MSKNMIQFQPGLSLTAFLKQYGSEEQCRAALYDWRWPKGYECPKCGHHSACKLNNRQLYQCNRCHHQSSVIAGTIFQDTKLPLSVWFLGIYFITQSTNGGTDHSALHFVSDAIGARSRLPTGFETIHRAFEV